VLLRLPPHSALGVPHYKCGVLARFVDSLPKHVSVVTIACSPSSVQAVIVRRACAQRGLATVVIAKNVSRAVQTAIDEGAYFVLTQSYRRVKPSVCTLPIQGHGPLAGLELNEACGLANSAHVSAGSLPFRTAARAVLEPLVRGNILPLARDCERIVFASGDGVFGSTVLSLVSCLLALNVRKPVLVVQFGSPCRDTFVDMLGEVFVASFVSFEVGVPKYGRSVVLPLWATALSPPLDGACEGKCCVFLCDGDLMFEAGTNLGWH
jgi:hypothetical protein